MRGNKIPDACTDTGESEARAPAAFTGFVISLGRLPHQFPMVTGPPSARSVSGLVIVIFSG